MPTGSNSRWTEQELSILEERFPYEPVNEIAKDMDRSPQAIKHKARRVGIKRADNYQKIKLCYDTETPDFDDKPFSDFICGFVAGEGSFTRGGDVDGAKFTFTISLAQVDSDILYEIQDYFSCGNVYEYESREDHWEDTAQYQVQAIGEIYSVIIPFFEQHDLRSTHKQEQFRMWRDEFMEHHGLDRKI
jgi:hypothetical protein